VPLHRENFPRPLRTVAVFGPGLIGGSLALALRQRKPAWKLKLWTRTESSLPALRKKFPTVEVTCRAEEAAAGADLIVFCTPVGTMPALAKAVASHLKPTTVITDAGSVKADLVRKMEAALPNYVGAHPMAGSEKSGLEAAREDLFQNAVCILTPTKKSRPDAVRAVRSLWKLVGCKLVELTAMEHDKSIARVSHLPHLAASVLVNAIAQKVPDAGRLAGGGYRDTTRVASGPAKMWSEILLENRKEIMAGLKDFTAMLNKIKTLLETENTAALEAFLADAKTIRDRLS